MIAAAARGVVPSACEAAWGYGAGVDVLGRGAGGGGVGGPRGGHGREDLGVTVRRQATFICWVCLQYAAGRNVGVGLTSEMKQHSM